MTNKPEPIRELDGITPDHLTNEILTSTEPLVLKGLVRSWPIVQAALKSDDEADLYVRRFYQGATMTVMHGAPEIGDRYFYSDDMTAFNYASSRVDLNIVLDALREQRHGAPSRPIYVGSSSIDNYLPGFRAENDLDLGNRQSLLNIWIGNRSRIPAHFDLPDNLACIAAGRRRFTLFPPDQLSNLYVGPLDFNPAGQAISLVDFVNPDFGKYPKFRTALDNARIAELDAGDVLFIPSMWWHHVEALGSFNILINYWWRQSPDYMDTPLNTLMYALLTIRDLPVEQRRAWQELFRHYVFDSDGTEIEHIPEHARGILGPFTDDSARTLRALLLNKIKR